MYHPLNIQDLLSNQTFRAWVLDSASSENSEWDLYLQRYPEEQETINKAIYILKSISSSKANISLADRNQILSNITKEISTPQESVTKKQTPIRKMIAPIMAAAASLALFLFASNYESHPLEFQSMGGSIAQANLADGSIVTLQGNSRIWMQNAFADGEKRIIHLENQAFFDISSSPAVGSNEFSVVTDLATIDVLGTRFLVDEDEFEVTVVVEEGKVKVTPTENSANTEPVYLTAGDKLVMHMDHSVETTKLSSVMKYTSIKDGAILFEGATTQDFIEDIEDYFDYHVIAPEALLTSKRAFDGTFPNQDIDLIMKSFSTTLGVSYTIEGQEIKIEYPQKD